MPNLLDYIRASQFDSIYEKPLNNLDLLALTELSYLPFDDLVTGECDLSLGIRLDHLAQAFDSKYTDGFPPFSMVTKNRLTLLSLLAQSNRFKYVKAFAYVNDYNLDQQKQFAVLSYAFNRETYVTSFRGTDDTIIGWKEDCHMTYMKEIPAQSSALNYLTQLLEKIPGHFFVTGHSKGGNLALYASSQRPTNLQEQVAAVLAFDAPGLHQSIIQSAGYQAIEDRIRPIIPQNSIVGMMLETPKNAQIVHSTTIGLLQHISFSWEIDGDDFKFVPSLTDNSVQMDQTLKTWTASLSDQELQDFFDIFFGVFIEAGIHRFSDITIDTPQKIQQVIENSQRLTAEEQAMVNKLIRQLVDTRYQIWRESLAQLFPNPQARLEEWWQQNRKTKKEEGAGQNSINKKEFVVPPPHS